MMVWTMWNGYPVGGRVGKKYDPEAEARFAKWYREQIEQKDIEWLANYFLHWLSPRGYQKHHCDSIAKWITKAILRYDTQKLCYYNLDYPGLVFSLLDDRLADILLNDQLEYSYLHDHSTSPPWIMHEWLGNQIKHVIALYSLLNPGPQQGQPHNLQPLPYPMAAQAMPVNGVYEQMIPAVQQAQPVPALPGCGTVMYSRQLFDYIQQYLVKSHKMDNQTLEKCHQVAAALADKVTERPNLHGFLTPESMHQIFFSDLEPVAAVDQWTKGQLPFQQLQCQQSGEGVRHSQPLPTNRPMTHQEAAQILAEYSKQTSRETLGR